MERVFQLLFLSFCMGFIVLALLSEPARAKDVKTDNLDAKLNEVLQKLDAVSCAASGYIDNLDGTVCDCTRNLMWEKKTGTVGDPSICTSGDDCPDPHDVNNRYSWISGTTDPDGTLFTVFLAQLNDVAGGGTNCFAGHCDWRLPKVGAGDDIEMPELETILDFSEGYCGGDIGACINPIFGPTGPAPSYWSSTTVAAFNEVFIVFFTNGSVGTTTLPGSLLARAVRSCE